MSNRFHLSFIALAACSSVTATARAQSASQEVQIYGGEMFGDRLLKTPLSGRSPQLDDNITFGGRYTYNFMKWFGVQVEAGYTPSRAARVASGDTDLALKTVDLDMVWNITPNFELAGHNLVAYAVLGVGYAWADLDHSIYGTINGTPTKISDSNGYTANTGLGAKYYVYDNWFIDLDARYRYLNKLVSDRAQGLSTAETTLSIGYRF